MKNLISEKIAEIIENLKTIFDPEVPVNIWDLGIIYGVDYNLETETATIIMTFTSPNCPAIDLIPSQIEETLSLILGIENVDIQIVWEPTWSKNMLSEEAKLELDMF